MRPLKEITMLSRRLPLVFALVVVFSVLLAACGGSANAPTQAAPTQAAQTQTDATQAPEPAAPAGNADAVLTLGEQNLPTFTRNFNPFVSTALPGTVNVIHEPLMIYSSASGELAPWLATGYEWSDDLTTLAFTLRDGVLWSDGEPFTTSDVAFTFNLLKTAPGVNSSVLPALVGGTAYVDSVTAAQLREPGSGQPVLHLRGRSQHGRPGHDDRSQALRRPQRPQCDQHGH
jgi:ABC-type transport system substrate-binding protein